MKKFKFNILFFSVFALREVKYEFVLERKYESEKKIFYDNFILNKHSEIFCIVSTSHFYN